MSYSNGGPHSRTPEPLYGPNSTGAGPAPGQTTPLPPKAQPLLCSGHTRPVVHLQFSNMQVFISPSPEVVAYHKFRLTDGTYQLISACKDGNPMLRSWIGDWIGTFLGKLPISSQKCRANKQRSQRRSLVNKALARCVKSSHRQCRFLSVRHVLYTVSSVHRLSYCRKIWDTSSGEAIHTFAHNHIVRSVALSPQATPQYLLTVNIFVSAIRTGRRLYRSLTLTGRA